MFRKLFFTLLLCGLLISACAPTVQPTPISTPTVRAPATSTATLVPTPTENPLAGAPEGTTGKNDQGEWIKTVEGVTYVYKTVTDPKQHEVLTQGWYKDIIVNPTYEGGIPLVNELGFPTSMALHVWCEEGLQCPTIQHNENGDKIIPDPSFVRMLIPRIQNRVAVDNPQYKDNKTFDADFAANKISISFTTARGDTYEYKIRPGSSMNIYISNKDLAKPHFSSKNDEIHASTSGDDDYNLNVVEYYTGKESIESFSPREFAAYLLRYPFVIFFTDDMSRGSVQHWIGNTGVILAPSIQGDNPYFVIIH